MLSKVKSEALYYELALKLNEIIPVKWDRILFYSEIKVGSISIYYVFYESDSKQLKDFSSLTEEYGLDDNQCLLQENYLYSIVSDLNKAFIEEGGQSWTTMTFILNNDGKFKVDFGYEDLEASDIVERRAAWEAKYL